MPLTTVTNVTSTGQKMPLCSCGWEGTKTSDNSGAWREADTHAQTHGERAGFNRRRTETTANKPGGETRG